MTKTLPSETTQANSLSFSSGCQQASSKIPDELVKFTLPNGVAYKKMMS